MAPRPRKRRPNVAAVIFVLWFGWLLLGWTQYRTTETTMHDGIRTTAHVDWVGFAATGSDRHGFPLYGSTAPVRLAFTTVDGRRATYNYVMYKPKIGKPVDVVYRRDLSNIVVAQEGNGSTTEFWTAFVVGTAAAIAGLVWVLPVDSKRFKRGRER